MKNIEKYIIVILSFIAVGAIGAAVYFGVGNKQVNVEEKLCPKCESCNDDSESEENIADENYETEENIDNEIYARINFSNDFLFPSLCSDEYSFGESFINKFYAEGINLKEFTKNDLITAAFYEINNVPVCNEKKALVDLYTINDALENKFNDSSLKITLEDLKKYNGDNINFEFQGNDIFVSSNNCDGCGVGPQPFYKKNIEKYELENNYLYVYYRAAYFDVANDDYMDIRYNVYKPTDVEPKNKVEEYVYIDNDQNINITWSKYTLYKATYELIDGELYFRSNEIIKK